MGFYNHCLGLILVWSTLGWTIRLADKQWAASWVWFGGLFLLASITHPLAWVVMVLGALVIAGGGGSRRGVGVVLVTAVMTSWVPLTFLFRHSSGVIGVLMRSLQDWLDGKGSLIPEVVIQAIKQLPTEWFAHTGSFAVVLASAAVSLLSGFGLWSTLRRNDVRGDGWHWPVLSLAAATTLAFLFLPVHLGGFGGFLKTRLAVLPPLLFLAAIGPRLGTGARAIITVAFGAGLGISLVFAWHYGKFGNEQLNEYTAAIPITRPGSIIYVLHADSGNRPDCLLHAADYYCLENDCVNLDNYQAERPEFPVRFATGWRRANGPIITYSHRNRVDCVLVWGSTVDGAPLAGFRIAYKSQRLTVWVRGS